MVQGVKRKCTANIIKCSSTLESTGKTFHFKDKGLLANLFQGNSGSNEYNLYSQRAPSLGVFSTTPWSPNFHFKSNNVFGSIPWLFEGRQRRATRSVILLFPIGLYRVKSRKLFLFCQVNDPFEDPCLSWIFLFCPMFPSWSSNWNISLEQTTFARSPFSPVLVGATVKVLNKHLLFFISTWACCCLTKSQLETAVSFCSPKKYSELQNLQYKRI